MPRTLGLICLLFLLGGAASAAPINADSAAITLSYLSSAGFANFTISGPSFSIKGASADPDLMGLYDPLAPGQNFLFFPFFYPSFGGAIGTVNGVAYSSLGTTGGVTATLTIPSGSNGGTFEISSPVSGTVFCTDSSVCGTLLNVEPESGLLTIDVAPDAGLYVLQSASFTTTPEPGTLPLIAIVFAGFVSIAAIRKL